MNAESLLGSLAGLAAAPVQLVLDRGVERSTAAASLCRDLDGRTLQIDPGSEALAGFFAVADGTLRYRPGIAEAPDATLLGTPLSIARLAGPDPEAVIREGDVEVRGDADVAEAFQYLLKMVRPDWEEELSRVTGDVVAHEAGRFVRGVGEWLQVAGDSVARSTGEYLTEESRVLATQAELDEFCDAVDALSAAVDRAEARLRILRNEQASDAS